MAATWKLMPGMSFPSPNSNPQVVVVPAKATVGEYALTALAVGVAVKKVRPDPVGVGPVTLKVTLADPVWPFESWYMNVSVWDGMAGMSQ